MNHDQEWIARNFLNEVAIIKPDGELWPMYKAEIRLRYCEMIEHEFPGDDAEQVALLATAGAVRDLFWSPSDREVIERFIAARHAHADLLKSLLKSLEVPPDDNGHGSDGDPSPPRS